jgi:hypothetical protein
VIREIGRSARLEEGSENVGIVHSGQWIGKTDGIFAPAPRERIPGALSTTRWQTRLAWGVHALRAMGLDMRRWSG